jgi:predicted Zn-dependent protease with MMP-like domain
MKYRKSFTMPIQVITMDDELPETVKKCFKILEENIDILSNIEIDLQDEKEDEIMPDMKLHQLFDMTEDVSGSSKIKRAEFNLVRRQAEEFL